MVGFWDCTTCRFHLFQCFIWK